MTKILHIDSSSAIATSSSRKLSKAIVEKITKNNVNAQITYRDLTQSNLQILTEAQVGAFFTPADARSNEQKQIIKFSDTLVAEMQAADIIVIGIPMYNFAMPASFKLYQDLIARVGVTFHYTEQGPKGLLENKKLYIARTSGGVELGSDYDFLTPTLAAFFNLIGINDVVSISSGGTALAPEASMQAALEQIEKLVA